MDAATRRFVRERAENRCEYCGLRQEHSPLANLQNEHILPKKHGGGDDAENLALACIDCNLHKGTNLAGIDPQTGKVAAVFNPRKQLWSDHFEWQGAWIVGLTPIGRATVAVLDLNDEPRLELRMLHRS
ncbi:MAG TPA: HNH endonuclease [Pirellulales bacterium]|nr:HNH endonuclease [Pirellulales bacterium]